MLKMIKPVKRLTAWGLMTIMTFVSCVTCADAIAYGQDLTRAYAAVKLTDEKEDMTESDAEDESDESPATDKDVKADTATDRQVIEIANADDLIALSENCRLDSYSSDKYVKLTQDITLAGTGYKPIPIFLGVFDGCGHKIDGFIYSEDANYGGLICKTGEGAIIQDLTVAGNISPEGKQMVLGGIVGDNYGHIINCRYIGIVKGNDYIGGIAGYNEMTGIIMDSYSYGNITGQHYTGGIAGANSGGIYRCGNEASVNTTNEDRTIDFDDINVDRYLSGVLDLSGNSDEAKEVSAANSTIDCGGIAGYSTGAIEYCSNVGDIGYEHVGYNVGGIAGRQSGYVHSCTNSGHVLGRKDVGGIVGQAEPYVDLDLSEDMISKLTDSINDLHDLIGDTLTDSSAQSDVISDRLTIIQKFASDALSSADYLSDATITWADGITGAANELMGRVDYAVDEAGKEGGAIDHGKSAATNVSKAADALSDAADAADINNYMSAEEKDRYDSAKNRIKDNSAEYQGYYDKKAAEYTEEYTREHPDEVANAAKAYANTQFADRHGGESYEKVIGDDAKIIADIIATHEGEMSKDAADSTNAAMDALKGASNNLSDMASDTDSIADNLSNRDDITMPSLGDGYRAGTGSFMAALKAMSDNMGALNNELNGTTDVMTEDMQKVNDSFNTIMLLFADAMDGALNAKPDDMYEDESIEFAMSAKEGTVADCTNSGRIEGDIDTAGIAGAMALEYDFDLEGDSTGIKDSKAGAVYKTRCILRSNDNKGRITGTKSYVGGMTGSQEMGIIIDCDNYGRIKSDTGNYVGGIAGNSISDIRNSRCKCVLSGGRYIGGIAGYAHNISGCVSMPSVAEGEEYTGAIAGEVSDDYDLHDNYYYSETLGGIDKISYEDMAKCVSFDELIGMEGVPKEFDKLVVTFLTGDDIETGSISVEYNGSISSEDYPRPYVEDGNYIRWEIDSADGIIQDMEIKGEEVRLLTTIAGSRLRGNGQSVILVDGSFKEGQNLGMQEYKNILDASGNQIEPSGIYRGLKERWEIEIPDDHSASHRIRIQAPAGVKDCDIYVSNGGEYVKADTSRMGMYELFDATGNRLSILIIDKTVPKWIYAATGATVAVIVLLCITVMVMHKKRSTVADMANNDSDTERVSEDGDTV